MFKVLTQLNVSRDLDERPCVEDFREACGQLPNWKTTAYTPTEMSAHGVKTSSIVWAFCRPEVMGSQGTVEVACRFEVRDLGPRVIQPDSFLITGYGSQQEWENYPHTRRFYKTFRLKSRHQAGIMPMVCEYYDWPLWGRPVTQAQIEEALGDYFSFRFPE